MDKKRPRTDSGTIALIHGRYPLREIPLAILKRNKIKRTRIWREGSSIGNGNPTTKATPPMSRLRPTQPRSTKVRYPIFSTNWAAGI